MACQDADLLFLLEREHHIKMKHLTRFRSAVLHVIFNCTLQPASESTVMKYCCLVASFLCQSWDARQIFGQRHFMRARTCTYHQVPTDCSLHQQNSRALDGTSTCYMLSAWLEERFAQQDKQDCSRHASSTACYCQHSHGRVDGVLHSPDIVIHNRIQDRLYEAHVATP